MLLVQPFIEFAFMRKALVACVAIAISATPLGVFLSLRRMSLVGDALSHAVLPGAAMGYLLSGLSLVAMGIGGLIAGLSVALLSGVVSRFTPLKEDASFSGACPRGNADFVAPFRRRSAECAVWIAAGRE